MAHTAGGTRLPIPVLIGMAAAGRVHPYLGLFDNPKKMRLYYGRRRRTASPAQRLALHALDRGCSKPGCDAPPDRSQVHHASCDWHHGGRTDIDHLTLACGCDNRLVDDTPTGWTTRKRRDGTTEWRPPPQIPLPGGTNDFHHPERLLPED